MKKERGEIKRVGDLFEKYKRTLIAPERTVVNVFCEVVEESLGYRIDPKSVKYTPHTRTLALIGKGMVRSEVQMHHDEILAHMKGRLGEKNAPTTLL